MDDIEPTTFEARVRYMIEKSLESMPDDDRQARIAWCQRTGNHGVTVYLQSDDMVRFDWGGRPLAYAARRVFADPDTYFQALEMTMIPTGRYDAATGEPVE